MKGSTFVSVLSPWLGRDLNFRASLTAGFTAALNNFLINPNFLACPFDFESPLVLSYRSCWLITLHVCRSKELGWRISPKVFATKKKNSWTIEMKFKLSFEIEFSVPISYFGDNINFKRVQGIYMDNFHWIWKIYAFDFSFQALRCDCTRRPELP